jgi:hypothetical protein
MTSPLSKDAHLRPATPARQRQTPTADIPARKRANVSIHDEAELETGICGSCWYHADPTDF